MTGFTIGSPHAVSRGCERSHEAREGRDGKRARATGSPMTRPPRWAGSPRPRWRGGERGTTRCKESKHCLLHRQAKPRGRPTHPFLPSLRRSHPSGSAILTYEDLQPSPEPLTTILFRWLHQSRISRCTLPRASSLVDTSRLPSLTVGVVASAVETWVGGGVFLMTTPRSLLHPSMKTTTCYRSTTMSRQTRMRE